MHCTVILCCCHAAIFTAQLICLFAVDHKKLPPKLCLRARSKRNLAHLIPRGLIHKQNLCPVHVMPNKANRGLRGRNKRNMPYAYASAAKRRVYRRKRGAYCSRGYAARPTLGKVVSSSAHVVIVARPSRRPARGNNKGTNATQYLLLLREAALESGLKLSRGSLVHLQKGEEVVKRVGDNGDQDVAARHLTTSSRERCKPKHGELEGFRKDAKQITIRYGFGVSLQSLVSFERLRRASPLRACPPQRYGSAPTGFSRTVDQPDVGHPNEG